MDSRNDFDRWFYWAAQNQMNGSGVSGVSLVSGLLGVPERTVRHWRAQKNAPGWAMRELIYASTGCPAGVTGARSDWSEWRFRREELFDHTRRGPRGGQARRYWGWVLESPTGVRWTSQELDNFALTASLCRDYAKELQRLKGPAQFLLPLG